MDISLFEQYESNVRGYIRSFPAVFDTATSATIVDVEGKRYIDFFGGAGSLNYGHNHPLINQALITYIQRNGITNALDKATVAKHDFISAFQSIILKPRKMDYKIQFVGPTGANGVETALKLARKMKKRSNVIAFTNAYHGHSLGALAVTGNEFYHGDYYDVPRNVNKMPYDNYFDHDMDSVDMLRHYLGDGSSGYELPAAVIVESIQGEGGINVASVGWLQKLSALCKEMDILLIMDEIQVGNGRTGDYFSFERAGIMPDIITLSKSIGTGMPMSIVLMKPSVDVWSPGEHTGTFRGNSYAFIAGAAALELWRNDDFSRSIRAKGKQVEAAFKDFQARFPGWITDVRGLGMIWGLESLVEGFCNEVSKQAFQRGLMMETAGASDQVLKFLGPLVISETELNEGFEILTDAILAAVAVFEKTGRTPCAA
ncbi:diaminobutyrate--2-oxoglutarate transaminase [Thiomicrospira cyclica]|uniref:Diaminobutyrate--2-oxoglutarate transaminase n=1 Tax=Thiomicrospira cyclica (strain DSM 14477 / JCM 11371 / ALM1) TaxID=717773 RepID=F6DBZ5_THICA|nr:diaminobutyrate--2-oxoglutarate transaminase [Thiomicrospira cyclica]AEG31381.1 diaminobutyrate/2-oxoglutarate aminotransferase [Thiomicrospira cyclica ALM1]